MSILQLDFAEPFFSIDYVESEDSYHIGKKSMVINLAEHEHENIFLDGERTVVPLKAAMVQDMTIRNLVKAFVIRDVERTDLNDPATVAEIKKTWKSLYEMSGIARHKGRCV